MLARLAGVAGAVTTIVITGAELPLASDALVQVTETLPLCVQPQPVPAADTNVTPAGSASTTLRSAAASGPALCTVRW